MSFGYPHLLWLLLLVPAVAVLVWWSFRVKARAMRQFIGLRLLPALTVGLSRTRQKARAVLFVCAFALALFALARPQWGFDLEEARQRGLDIVVAIDTSKSMLADDVSPNRLARARLASLDLMRVARSDRLGLVAFAGTAFLQCPLSLDDEAFRQSLEALDVNIIPQGGTAIAEAIQTALSAFKEQTENHKILVLFTDGEDHDPQGTTVEAARDAAKAGMRIFTIGVGTPSGELLSSRDPYGNRVFIKDAAGNVVKSRLNEALLQQISKETDGFYLPLSAGTVDMLYERGLAPLPKSEFSSKTMRRYHERFQWFLGAAILLLLAEMFFPERGKRKNVIDAPAKQAVVAIFLVATTCLSASASVTDALESYKRGKYSKARAEYERLAKKAPEDARLRFNAGAAAFQDEDYDEALRHFSSSLSARDLKLQQQGYYNLGNTQYRLGEQAKDAKEKQQNWEQAIQSYDNALRLEPKDEDARINKQVVQAKLEELKKQQQQQQENKDDQKQEQKDEQQKSDEEKKDDQKQQQDQSKQDQDKQDQQQKSEQQKQDEQQQQQEKQDQTKADQNKDQQAAQDQRGDKPDQNAQPADFSKVMQMTPQQAAQLLEAQKAEEKTMIFLPQVRTNRNNKTPDRVFKDW